MKTVLLGNLLLLLAAAASASHPMQRDGELLVRTDGPDGSSAIRALAGELDADVVSPQDPSGWTLLRERPRASSHPGRLSAALRRHARVRAVEPNWDLHATAIVDHGAGTWVPDDPLYHRQWNLMAMPAVWYETRGSEDVVVAVLDTGLRHTSTEAPVAVLPGRDLVNDDGDPDDDNGHGTHVASIIAQATDSGRAAAGLAPRVSILPVKVLDASGRGSLGDLIAGIYWATDAGAHVINLSLALPAAVTWSEALHDAVVHASSRGVVMVGAAGNNAGGRVSLPAGFNEVIAVGGIHSGGGRAAYSNGGAALDLVAPGGDSVDRDADGTPDGILALAFDPVTRQDGIFLGAGTSQAAAHVSGAAALLVSLGETGRDRIRSLLELSARRLEAEAAWSPATGYGSLDLARALATRGSLATVHEDGLEGFVEQGTGSGARSLMDPIGVVAAFRGTLLLVLDDGTHIWGLADAASGGVVAYRLRGGSVHAACGGRAEHLASRLERAGSVGDWLERSGQREGTIALAGGVSALIGQAGAPAGTGEGGADVLLLLDPSGAAPGDEGPDAAGGFAGMIAGAGGIQGALDGSGSLLELVGSAGGFVLLCESAGGVSAFVDASGGVIGLVGGLVDATVFGTPNGLLRVE